MIVLGEHHTFSGMEIESLQKQFESIDFISYKDTDTTTVIKDIESHIDSKSKSIIVLNTKAQVPNKLLTYLTKLEQEGIQYYSTESFLEKYLYKCYISSDQRNISFLERIKPYSWVEGIQKFIIDYAISIPLLILAFPFMIYAAYRIKKESPGPIFFKQKRVGRNGKEFSCIKFRSMRLDAEKDGVKFAIKNDERIFKWGETMRKTRIDELPQLWNVLKREMYLIGPRPERKYWIDQFEKEIPYYNERHIICPGITGWAQVMYPYGANSEDAKQKLMYDLYYIKHWNLFLEFKTIFRTAAVVFSREGV